MHPRNGPQYIKESYQNLGKLSSYTERPGTLVMDSVEPGGQETERLGKPVASALETVQLLPESHAQASMRLSRRYLIT